MSECYTHRASSSLPFASALSRGCTRAFDVECEMHWSKKKVDCIRSNLFERSNLFVTKLAKFTKLFDNVNPFTEAVVGEWELPDEVCA